MTNGDVNEALRLKADILSVLKKEGFIQDFIIDETEKFSKIVVTLKYTDSKERVIKGLKRISKPGLRVYAKVEELPRVLNGLGVALISTSNGVMTDKEARELKVGGEVLCFVY